jgi:hypothetical protein
MDNLLGVISWVHLSRGLKLTSINEFLDLFIRHARALHGSQTCFLFKSPTVDVLRIQCVDVNEGVQLAFA